ncbi:MAG: LLM class flavin-dependent oxidoreductase [Acidimicrobiia bacterium]|nr:LLM class flavin-dependent oxidoreductase [Acidimicrobiia bacterium]
MSAVEIVVGPYGMQSPHPHRRPHVEMYAELVEHARRAEELGFDGIALTEHSFWYDGYCPSLLPVLAALAQHTERIRLMTGALLLPQHDPLKVAEEAAVVDRLSGGRLVLGFGAGYRPEEFLGHGVPEGRWGSRFFEAVEVVRRALTEETFSFEGEFYRYEDVSLAVRPVQEPPPIWVCAGFRDWAAKGAGRRGWSFCTTGVPGGGDEALFATYEEAAASAGIDAAALRRGLFRDVMVMPSDHEAQALLREDYWAAMADQFVGFGFLKGLAPDGGQLTEVPDWMRDAFFADPATLVGTPEVLRERLRPSLDLGLDLLIVRTIWANFKSERALRTMETFAREVMPLVRSHGREVVP